MRIREKLKNLWPNLLKDERGQSTTEYILILSVVVMIAMRFKSTFSTEVGKMLTNLGTSLDSASTTDTSQ
jgi:Flp pilus assembly pilin Flp